MINNRGFTLIEVMVAVMMLGIAIRYSMDATQLVTLTQSHTRNVEIAQRIATTELEELLSAYNSDTRLEAGQHSQYYDMNGHAASSQSYFEAQWNVQIDTPITKIIQIDMYVNWNDDTGHTHTMHYLTFRGT